MLNDSSLFVVASSSSSVTTLLRLDPPLEGMLEKALVWKDGRVWMASPTSDAVLLIAGDDGAEAAVPIGLPSPALPVGEPVAD